MEELSEEKHGRFKGAPWYSEDNVYTLVGGAGGIGSWLSVLLSRAGFKPVVFDFDTLELHNLSGQLFMRSDVGKLKVEALRNIVDQVNEEDLQVFDEKYTQESMSNEYTFSAFDNMEARKDMFAVWKEANIGNANAIFIDGRLLMEQLTVFCITGDNYEAILEYEGEHLFSDDEVLEGVCTLKQTSHSAAMIASFMTSFFTNHITNVRAKSKVRNIPFQFQHFIPLNMTSYE